MKQQDTTQVRIKPDQLNISNIDISTNKQLRTRVLEIKDETPRHLVQTQPARNQHEITYQKLSHNDSIYLNLIPAESDNLFDKELSFQTVQTINESFYTAEPIETTTSDTLKTVHSPVIHSKPDSIQTLTLQPTPTHLKIRSSNQFEGSKEWLSGFIILALLIAGFVKVTANKYLNDIFSSVRYQQSATKLFSTFNIQNQKPGWALSSLFILSTSLLIFEYTMVMGRQPETVSNFAFLLYIIGGILIYFLLKNSAYRLVAFVFDTLTDTKAYLFNADLLNKVFGITILPIVSIVPFVDHRTASFLLKTGLVLFLLMYIVQLLRGVKIILRSPLSIFYMFLYFCALEILPLSILIKSMIL